MSLPSFRPRAALALVLGLCAAALRADPIINEFMASNSSTIADDNGSFSDWIEIFNPDASPANLAGWYLTDDLNNKTKWQFPAVTVPAGGYLLVWASGNNRRDPARPLHTSFSLKASGEYLALVKSDGATIVTEFANTYPAQLDDISYGYTQPTAAGETARRGFFRKPTPGARNGAADTLLLLDRVTFSRASGPFTGSISVTLSGAGAGQKIRYVLAPPSAGGAAVPEPGPTSPEYTGPITISASTVVRAAVFTSDNARGFPTTAHYVRLANSGTARIDTFTSNLPLLVIDTHGSGSLEKDGVDHAAWIYTWNAAPGGATALTAPPAIASSLTTSVRGASSSTFPKKGYSVRLDDTLGHGNAQPLFGLPAFDRWVLVGPWKYDRTYLHNAFIYALSNRIGRWAPRTQFVEVFFNANGGDLDAGDYAGVYILTDAIRMDPLRVNIASIDSNDTGTKKVTGGYIFKSDLPDPDEWSFQTRRGYPGEPFALIVHSPKAADMPQAQKDYTKNFMQALDDALAADQERGFSQRTHLDYIDRPAWVDHHILNVLAMNVDAFVRSAYMTKDRLGRLAAGPAWDFDRTMHGGDPRTIDPEVWNGGPTPGESVPTELWAYGWWGTLAQDPEFVQAWIDRWQKLRRNEFSTANLTTLIDSLAAQVGPAAAARDANRWPDNASRFGTWQGEVENLKTWLTRRTAWIDGQFAAAPTVVAAAGTLVVTPAPGTQLAYTTDGTDPRAIGGGLSNNARVSSLPVTVPDNTDLQARSYRTDFNAATATPPASAWSSAAGGPRSSTLTPRPRLTNISSRGFVGAGESVLITGVVVSDTAAKQYLARAAGPALTALGVGGALAQPVLKIIDGNGREIASNNGWDAGTDAGDIADFATVLGAFPFAKGSRDAALLPRLGFGQYTLQISSGNGGTGVALVELYEIDPEVGRTLNLSTRGLVRAGEGIMIGGVIVRGPGPKRILIRAIGPTLGTFGVATALTDPVLTLFNGSTRIASNDDWGTATGTTATAAEIATAATSVGAFALGNNSRDAALLLTLPEGNYTAQVAGKGNAEGVILLEAYELP